MESRFFERQKQKKGLFEKLGSSREIGGKITVGDSGESNDFWFGKSEVEKSGFQIVSRR